MIGSMRRALLPILAVVLVSAVLSGQEFVPAPGADPLHRPLDQILDVNVRDGLVYYGALKSAANAFGFKFSPVANLVSSFHGSEAPGAKTRFFM